MAKRRGGNSFSVSVEGLEQLARLPGFLDSAQRELLDKSSRRLAAEVAKRAPGGPGGSIGRDVEGKALTSTTAVVRSKGHPGAKALDRGAFIRAKRGRAIRFLVGGRVVYVRKPRGVRIPARGFYKKGLRSRGKVIRATYSEAFGDLHKHGGGSA